MWNSGEPFICRLKLAGSIIIFKLSRQCPHNSLLCILISLSRKLFVQFSFAAFSISFEILCIWRLNGWLARFI